MPAAVEVVKGLSVKERTNPGHERDEGAVGDEAHGVVQREPAHLLDAFVLRRAEDLRRQRAHVFLVQHHRHPQAPGETQPGRGRVPLHRHHGQTQATQLLAQPQADLAEADHHDVAAAGQGAWAQQCDQPRAEQLFLAPDSELVVSVVAFPALPERGFSGPTFLVQAFPAGQQAPITNQFIEGSADLAIGDAVYSLAAGHFVTVEVSRNPGLPLMIAGGGLALAAALLALSLIHI